MLKAIDAGDRIVKGRLELFSCARRRRLTVRQQEDLRRREPQSLADSPLGPMEEDAAQNLLVNLVSLMSLLFVDYDCSSISPQDFELCTDKHIVVSMINHNLALVVDRVRSGFLTEFWQAVQDAIDVANCDIYAFKPSSGSFEPTDNSLMSFHYFWIDVQRGRILFIGSVTKSRGTIRGGLDSDSNISLSQEDSANSKQQGSSMASSVQRDGGDYACISDASGDDPMLD